MSARSQGLATVDRANGDDDGNIADLEMADPVLDCDCQHIVLIRRLVRTTLQHIQGAGVLGVVERGHVGPMITIAYGANEQRYAADPRTRHQTDCPTDVKRRLADADLTNLRLPTVRWHASTLVPGTYVCGSLNAQSVERVQRVEQSD
jgi:hypothetical protein